MAEKHIIDAEMLINDEIAPGIHETVLAVGSAAAAEAEPGQFVNVYLQSDRMLLPRPISICDANVKDGTITLLYAVAGAGTAVLSTAVPGDVVRVTSPLGHGFALPGDDEPEDGDTSQSREHRRVVLVGGGIGSAPLFFAARILASRHIPTTVVLGFKKDVLLEKDFRDLGCRVYVTTELPTESAFIGNVTDCMSINEVHGDIYYACGPRSMLAAVTDYVVSNDGGAELQVSLEERMGCGYGACVGCVCDVGKTTPDGSSRVERLKVCHDGPVFDGKEVIW